MHYTLNSLGEQLCKTWPYLSVYITVPTINPRHTQHVLQIEQNSHIPDWLKMHRTIQKLELPYFENNQIERKTTPSIYLFVWLLFLRIGVV